MARLWIASIILYARKIIWREYTSVQHCETTCCKDGSGHVAALVRPCTNEPNNDAKNNRAGTHREPIRNVASDSGYTTPIFTKIPFSRQVTSPYSLWVVFQYETLKILSRVSHCWFVFINSVATPWCTPTRTRTTWRTIGRSWWVA